MSEFKFVIGDDSKFSLELILINHGLKMGN
jgi:hypothetical protein